MGSTGRSAKERAASRPLIPTRGRPLEIGKEGKEATERDGKEEVGGPVGAVEHTETERMLGGRTGTGTDGARKAGGIVEPGRVGAEAGVGVEAAGRIHGLGVGEERTEDGVRSAGRGGMLSGQRRRRKWGRRAPGAGWTLTMRS